MAISAQKNRATLHRLRDNLKRAKRAAKQGMPGAAERVKLHAAKKLKYAETRK